MGRAKPNPNQIPMGFLLPESDWTPPSSLPKVSRGDTVAIDIETRDDGLSAGLGPGWVYRLGYIAGVAISTTEESVYIPLRHPDTECHDWHACRDYLRYIFLNCRCVFHRAIYDLGWLVTEMDLPMPTDIDDTMIMEFMLNENALTFNLDDTCKRRGIKGKDETLLKKAAQALGCDPKKDMWRMPGRFVGPYAAQDARACRELSMVLRTMIRTEQSTEAYQLEVDLIPLIIHMRTQGISIDEDQLAISQSRLLQERNMYLSQLSEKLSIGRPIEISDVLSPKFLEGIFKSENLAVPMTAKGNPSFKTEEIEKLDHWLPELITGARKMHDAGEKFVGGYIKGFLHKGKIHAEIHQTKSDDGGTATTRFAYSDPPLQQMPSRNAKIKKMIRGLFLPRQGEIWGALDYSQQEYRLIVHFAYLCKILGADKAVHAYRNDPLTDFHTLAAELTKLPRRRAKDVNFAKAFGAGVAKFALMTGMSIEEAADVMMQYDELLPFVKGLAEFVQKRASSKGYIRLIDGARSHFDAWEPRWYKGPYYAPTTLEEARRRVRDQDHPWEGKLKRAMTHKAMNRLIQGSAARQTKLCMLECWKEGIPPLLQMHDELDFSFGEQRNALRAKEIMVETVRLEIPVVVDAEFGVNWGSAAEDKDRGYSASWDEAWNEMRMAV
jgi:DNA polymerase I-like protein with 3'-5' exonuclease and polymerase domains